MEKFCEYYCLNIFVSMNIIVRFNSFNGLSIILKTDLKYYKVSPKEENKIDGRSFFFGKS